MRACSHMFREVSESPDVDLHRLLRTLLERPARIGAVYHKCYTQSYEKTLAGCSGNRRERRFMHRLTARLMQRRFSRIPRTGISASVLLLLVVFAGATIVSSPTARADNTTNISMVVPVANNGTADGPVGTNITLAAVSMPPNSQFDLGYAQASVGCPYGYTVFPSVSPVTSQNDGTFTVTFAWPVSLGFVGTTYAICARNKVDHTTTLWQVAQFFRVDSATPPQFTVTAAPTGMPSLSGNSFQLGQQVVLTGQSYFPAGTTLAIYLRTSKASQPSDLQPPAATQISSDQPITSQQDGTVSATVSMPNNIPTGSYVLYLVSQDGTATTLPSLVAHVAIKLTPAAAVTPTVVKTPQPTATPFGNQQPGSSQGPGKMAEVLGLGGLSVILFVIGVVLLASSQRRA